MPVNASAKLLALSRFPLKLNTHKFKYLGIWVTQKFKDIFKANFPPLVLCLKQDLERWSLLPLSLGGRINAIKMNVLPKFLYVFQCIPVFLSKSFFLSVDKLISGFIWNKKNPRIRKSMLQRHRHYGGLALPNFRFYYWAANIQKHTVLEGISYPSYNPQIVTIGEFILWPYFFKSITLHKTSLI